MKQAASMLDRLAGRSSRTLHNIGAAVLMSTLACVVAGDVFARYLFKAPINGAQDIGTLALLMLFMAGLPACTAAHQHVKVETLLEHLSPRWQGVCDAISGLAGLVFVAIIGYWQIREMSGMLARGEQSDVLALPLWPVAGFIGLCSLATCLVLLAGIRTSVLQARGRRGAP